MSAHPTWRSALVSLLLALAACSGDSSEPFAQSSAPPVASSAPPSNGPAPLPPAAEPASPPTPTPPTPSALFVVGDSLSDVGNVAAAADYVLNVPLDPPTVGLCNPVEVLALKRRCDDLFYLQSRVSDGPVAVEHLAEHLGLAPLRPSLHLLPNQSREGTVYAVAGAKARGVADEDLARQVDWLLARHALLPPDALYVIMIGGNDAIDALQADFATPAAAVEPSAAIVTAAIAAIAAQAERLLAFGARQVVVANVPDLASVPAVRVVARARRDEAAALAAASAISVAFNRELDAKLDDLQARVQWLVPTPIIARFDLYAALSAAQLATAAAGGNAVDACFATDVYRESSAAQRVFHPDCAPAAADGAPRFAQFAFFDGIHPTGTAHAVLGAALAIMLQPPATAATAR
jgi:phospholipase/lecithinase/hemolysin